ncbi:hypothetical protein TNCV_1491191 [Trichonephila clavipes]|nr:hypothetical protein TNCV_1491191 [Trichonephila clavipes]
MYDMNQIRSIKTQPKKLSPSEETEYSDVNKRRVTSKFAHKSTEKAVYGAEKFKRDTLIVALNKLIFDLNRRSQVYAEYRKKLKFLMDLQHQNDFMRGRIIGKIEEGRKITDVAREFGIAHSVVSRLWKSFKTTGMCSRRHGEVVLEVRRLQKTDISSYQQKGTGAPQLSRWQISFLLPQESRTPEKLLPDV